MKLKYIHQRWAMAHPGPYQQQAKTSAQQAKGSSRMGQNFIPFLTTPTCKMKETRCKKERKGIQKRKA